MKKYILLLLLIRASLTFAQSYSEVKVVGGIPTIYFNGTPLSVSGWMLGRGTDTPFDSVIHQIDIAADQGLSTVQYACVWKIIAPDSLSYNWVEIDSVVNYAASKGLKIILDISPTMKNFPAWYGTLSGPSTLHPERFVKNQFGQFPVDTVWHLTWHLANFYHPDFYKYAGAFVKAVVNRYKDNPNLLGWMILQTYTGESNYPCEPGVVGEQIFDYSEYSDSLYGQTPPLPLAWVSQDLPDDRPEWRDWYNFRLQMKRQSSSYFGNLIDSLDPNHIIGIFPMAACFGDFFSSSSALMGTGYDYAWLTSQPWLDFVRAGSPQFCKYSFDLFEGYSCYPERAFIQVAYHNGKAVINEPTRTSRASPVGGDFNIEFIPAIVALHHVFGASYTWYYAWKDYTGGAFAPGKWTPEEIAKIGESKQIEELPRPDTLIPPKLAIVDFPVEHSFYYTENTYDSLNNLFIAQRYSVLNNMEMLNAFADAGIPYDVVDPDFIIAHPEVLNNYNMIILTLPKQRVQTYCPALWSILSGYSGTIKDMEGIFTPSMKLYEFYRKQLSRSDVLDSLITPLRDTMDTYNIPRHIYPDYGILIYGLKPYLWCFIPDSVFSYSGEVQFDITGWNLPQGAITITEQISGEIDTAQVVGEKLVAILSFSPQKLYLFSVGSVGIEENSNLQYSNIPILQISQNPFIKSTTICYALSDYTNIRLTIYDLSGRLVKTLVNEEKPAGRYEVKLPSTGLTGGIYFCKLKVDDKTVYTEKLLFLR